MESCNQKRLLIPMPSLPPPWESTQNTNGCRTRPQPPRAKYGEPNEVSIRHAKKSIGLGGVQWKCFHWLKIQVPDYYVTCGGDPGLKGRERDFVYRGAELGNTAADRRIETQEARISSSFNPPNLHRGPWVFSMPCLSSQATVPTWGWLDLPQQLNFLFRQRIIMR
jgi:hypothetical protein